MEIEFNNRPDYRLTTRYSRLPNNKNISMSNADIDRGLAGDRWNYGIGFAKPLGNAPAQYTNIAIDYTQYLMPNAVYKLPTANTVKIYRENEFNPPIATPEEAKLYQGPQTLNNR